MLQPPDAAQLVDLADFAAKHEDQRSVVDPQDHDGESSQSPGIDGSRIELADVGPKGSLGQLEQQGGDGRRDHGLLGPDVAAWEILVEAEEHEADDGKG